MLGGPQSQTECGCEQIPPLPLHDQEPIPGRGNDGNFFHNRIQTVSGARPASYAMCTHGSYPGGKVEGAWSWPLTSN
jgi:hypothetical protein